MIADRPAEEAELLVLEALHAPDGQVDHAGRMSLAMASMPAKLRPPPDVPHRTDRSPGVLSHTTVAEEWRCPGGT